MQFTKTDLNQFDQNIKKDIYWIVNNREDIKNWEKYTPKGIMTDENQLIFNP